MTEETRELTVKLTLPAEDWARLEKYAKDEGKAFREYLEAYINLGISTALREGYIFDAFRNKSAFQLAHEKSCTTECPRYVQGNCPHDLLTLKTAPE